MLFNSFIFLIYLPVVFCLYWFVFRSLKIQNIFIVIASYIFYGWWDWRFLILIILTSLCSFLSGIFIERYQNRNTRRLFLWGNVIINLGILATFKYYNFFVNNLQILLRPIGIEFDDITSNLILPVGISFYTFQALSYSIDVYRGRIKATRNISAFLAFISFFPQLVAGPIERATNLLPQFLSKRNFDYDTAVDGCRQILWGLFKKMVVADNCAVVVNNTFADYAGLGGLNLWIGAFLFTMQIYGDFSGYSDIAIGVAKLFGIKLMKNFNVPYFSRDIAEFWRRWHMSLNTWFVDYLYIPLGGSRCSKSKVVRNTFAIFLVSGLWHGAEWTFVAWGAYHAFLFIPLSITGKNRRFRDTVAGNRLFPTMSEATMMALTFLLVLIGWILFRADNLTIAWEYLCRMLTNLSFTPPLQGKMALMYSLCALLTEWFMRHHPHPFYIYGHGLLKYRLYRWIIYLGIVLICLTRSGNSGEFIYFQF